MPKIMWEETEQAKTNAVIGGRKGNTDKYKPGVKAMILVSQLNSNHCPVNIQMERCLEIVPL